MTEAAERTTAPSSRLLIETVERLAEAHTLEQVTAAVTAAVRRLLGADGATFVLREDDLCFYADEDAIGPMWKGQRFPMSACISGWAMEHRQSVSIEDVYADERIPHDAYRPTFVQSLTMTPIRSAEPIGALGAYWREPHTPTPSQVRHLEVLANSAATALENLELRSTVKRRESERHDLEVAIHSFAHDLRNPVVAMTGYAELIEADLDVAPELVRAYAQTIVSAGHRLSDQIDKMLTVYRVLDRPIEPVAVDLTALAREVADQLRSQVLDRAIRFEIEEGLVAQADPVLVRIALENLLGNAVKYSARRSEALVEVGRAEGTETVFVVRDNGVGFDPEQAHRLFQPLSRLHPDTEFEGTGLGLASVARVVELHGGLVYATGRPGEGASFFFSLPGQGAAPRPQTG